jgi:L-gulonate 3-dehydrogenase
MNETTSGHVAIIGGGLVGSGWSIVFGRAGETVKIYDANPAIRDTVLATIQGQLGDLKDCGLIDDAAAIMGNISVHDTMREAMNGAAYVQESVLERTDVKTEVSAEISACLGENTIVGSSTSGIPGSAFTEDLPNRDQFLVAHPVNPPYLAPIVEVVPTPWTKDEAVETAIALMRKVGQSPVLVRREIEGFLLNRLQGALLREAWALFEEGYASAEDIDKTVSEGLGLRWAFMGPFETIDLNAPGGVRDYAERLGPLYHSIDASRTDPKPWSTELIRAVEAERRTVLAEDDLAKRRDWRDRRLMALAAHKASLKDE